MSATLRLERTYPSAIWDRKPWRILLDGQDVGEMPVKGHLETTLEPGPHTVKLTSKGNHRSPEHAFEAKEGSVVGLECHPQPVWPMALWAVFTPGRWIAIKEV